jgi:class 3 adenylate cyclase
MAAELTRRCLSAIFATDMTGFSRMTGQDDAATLTALDTRHRDVLPSPVSKKWGRLSNSSDPSGQWS